MDASPKHRPNHNYLKSNRIVTLAITVKKIEENLVYIVLRITTYVVLKNIIRRYAHSRFQNMLL